MRAQPMLPVVLLLAGCGERPVDPRSPDTAPPGSPACFEPGIICTFAGVAGSQRYGAEGVPATASYLNLPTDVVVAPNGDVYVMDTSNHRIRRVDAEGIIRTVSGTGMTGNGRPSDDGIGTEGAALEFAWNFPTSAAFAPGDDEDLWVAGWNSWRVNRIALDEDWVHFEVGSGTSGFGGDGGDAASANVDHPSSVVFDDDGNLYVSDQTNQVIRRVDPDGVITTIAGTPETPGYAGDGGPALEAMFRGFVHGIAPSSFLAYGDGVLYVADTRNQVVRAIDLATGLIDRVAGTFVDNGEATASLAGAVGGYGGDGGDALDAQLYSPTDVAVGPRGELYVADMDNHCVRVVEDGVIDTFAGVCGMPGDDAHAVPAREALLDRPIGVAVAPDGAVYIADYNNSAIRVVR